MTYLKTSKGKGSEEDERGLPSLSLVFGYIAVKDPSIIWFRLNPISRQECATFRGKS